MLAFEVLSESVLSVVLLSELSEKVDEVLATSVASSTKFNGVTYPKLPATVLSYVKYSPKAVLKVVLCS